MKVDTNFWKFLIITVDDSFYLTDKVLRHSFYGKIADFLLWLINKLTYKFRSPQCLCLTTGLLLVLLSVHNLLHKLYLLLLHVRQCQIIIVWRALPGCRYQEAMILPPHIWCMLLYVHRCKVPFFWVFSFWVFFKLLIFLFKCLKNLLAFLFCLLSFLLE